MAIDPTDFDPYHKWLGIPKNRRPPTHYDLLGVSLDEDDREVIRSAAQQRKSFVESQRGKGHDAAVAGVLYQLSEAEVTLVSPELRRDYDRRLNLFHKRRRNRQIDPYGTGTQFNSRPGRVVGEDSGIVGTFLGIMAVLIAGFALMAGLSFYLPWSKLPNAAKAPEAKPQPGSSVPVQPDNVGMNEPSDSEPALEKPLQPTETAKEVAADGWIPLFNGHSLSGWRLYEGGAPGDGWSADDETLVLKGGRGKDTISEWQFENFELEFEWMSDGNSGILYRVRTGDVSAWLNSLKYEIHGENSGALDPVFTVSNPVRPQGEFNQSRIVARGDSLEHWINGTKVVDVTIGDSAWKEAISHIRFRDRPDFARAKRGHICLQDMGDDITFRNIRIRPLTDKPVLNPTGETPEGTLIAEPPVLVPTGKLRMGLKGHTATITQLAVSPDGRCIATASDDQTVRLWNRRTGEEVWKTDPLKSGFYAMKFEPKGERLFVAAESQVYRIDVPTGYTKSLHSFQDSNFGLATGVMDFSPDCRRIIVINKDSVSIYDIESQKRILHISGIWVPFVKFSESGKEYFIGEFEEPHMKSLRLFRQSDKKLVRTFSGVRDRVIELQISPDGKFVAAALGQCQGEVKPSQCKILVWEMATGNLVREFHTPQSWQYGLAFSPDSRMLVSGGGGWEQDWYGHGPVGDKTIHLWHIESGKELRRFPGHEGAVRAIAFTPDSKSFVSAGFDGIVRIWDARGDAP